MSGKRIAIYGKGGIGKTTISVNLALLLARRGLRTLLVGCDPKKDTARLLSDRSLPALMEKYEALKSGAAAPEEVLFPALTLGIPSAGMMARVSRSAFLEVLPQNYIRTARAKGLKERLIIWRHTLKNAMIPILSLIGTDMSRLITGTMIAESVFSWPGIGKYGYDALFYKDMPALQATVLILAVTICGINLIVDILYGLVDPRVRVSQKGGQA